VTAAAEGRRIDIQGLRALAVLLVVLYHCALPVPGGYIGVDVFFVISGFVITRMLAAELEASGTLSLRRFYLRRIRRLLPALALTTTLVTLLGIAANPIGTQDVAAYTGAAASLFAANAHLYRSAPGYFAPGSDLNPFLHTWSLAVEEQFYLVFPALLLVTWWAAARWLPEGRRRGAVALAMAGVLLASFVLSYAMSYRVTPLAGLKAPMVFAFYGSPTRAWEFAAGVLLALQDWRWRRLGPNFLLAAGLVGLALVAAGSAWLDASAHFPGLAALVPVVGTALLIASGSGAAHVLSRALGTRPMVWIGDRSYGWYLWHWPFVVFARALLPGAAWAPALAGLASLAPTWASYRWLENPLRAGGRGPAWRTLGLGAACVAVPVAACAALLLANRAIVGSARMDAVGEALRLHEDVLQDCLGLEAFDRPGCSFGPADGARGVILVGDSNAGQFTEPVVAAAVALGMRATVATSEGCPFVDMEVRINGDGFGACREFVQGTLARIAERRPDLVIVAQASDGYIREPDKTFRVDGQGAVATDPEAKAIAWRDGLARTLAAIGRTSRVLVIHPVPRFPEWSLDSCAAGRLLWDRASCAPSATRAEVERWRARAVGSERAAVATVPASTGLDLDDLLCDAKRCASEVDGRWLYRDGAHLSVRGALSLTEPLRLAMAERLGR